MGGSKKSSKKEESLITTSASEAMPWHSMEVSHVLTELQLPESLLTTGLSSEEAAARLKVHGPNRMSEKEQATLLQRIWHHVGNVLVGILVVVAVVSIIRALTSTTTDNKISNWIQAALIAFVIT